MFLLNLENTINNNPTTYDKVALYIINNAALLEILYYLFRCFTRESRLPSEIVKYDV